MSTTTNQNTKASKASTLPQDSQQVTQATTRTPGSTSSVKTLDATTTQDPSESRELIPKDINKSHRVPRGNSPAEILARGNEAERKFWLARNDSNFFENSGSNTKTG